MDLQIFLLKKVGVDISMGAWLAAFAPHKMWWLAILIAIIAGLPKEVIDVFVRKSQFDYLDWLATAAGGVITAIFIGIGIM